MGSASAMARSVCGQPGAPPFQYVAYDGKTEVGDMFTICELAWALSHADANSQLPGCARECAPAVSCVLPEQSPTLVPAPHLFSYLSVDQHEKWKKRPASSDRLDR